MDGASRLIKLRSSSIGKAVAFVESNANSGDHRAQQMLRSVFRPIKMGIDLVLSCRFVKECGYRQVVAVASYVKQWDESSFLVHLCLSLGSQEI